jgi:hypothetical protein
LECSRHARHARHARRPATRVDGFHLDAPLARVVPLFTARGEREWVPGWEPVVLSGAAERGSAFRTRGAGDAEVTWIVTDYRPAEGRLSYARLVAGSNIGLVDVICSPSAAGGTDVQVRYTLTPLNPGAEAYVTGFLAADNYATMLAHWRAATSAALARVDAPY